MSQTLGAWVNEGRGPGAETPGTRRACPLPQATTPRALPELSQRPSPSAAWSFLGIAALGKAEISPYPDVLPLAQTSLPEQRGTVGGFCKLVVKN